MNDQTERRAGYLLVRPSAGADGTVNCQQRLFFHGALSLSFEGIIRIGLSGLIAANL